MIVHDKLFIGGEWVASTGRETLEVISPLTEETIAKVPEATTEDIDRAVAAARRAFDDGPWPRHARDRARRRDRATVGGAAGARAAVSPTASPRRWAARRNGR